MDMRQATELASSPLFSGNPQVPTGEELNREAWESARERNIPSEFTERYRQSYRSGFEQGYKDKVRPAF